MGDDRQAVNKATIFYALCYELALWLAQRFPKLAFSPWFKLLVKHCRPFWAEWKTQQTLQAVDEQAAELRDQWEKSEREERAASLAAKAQEQFPSAKVTPMPYTVVPSVLIETDAAPDASDEVKALGGELRITYRILEE